MKSEFVEAFRDAKNDVDKIKSSCGGYKIIFRLAGWRLIPSILWELVTTFFAYLPAADYHRYVCNVVDGGWGKLSDEERRKVLSTLIRLDGHGEISAVLDNKGPGRHHA